MILGSTAELKLDPVDPKNSFVLLYRQMTDSLIKFIGSEAPVERIQPETAPNAPSVTLI